jgi:nucleoside-diphosphate-sugar epimerase
MRTLVAGGGGFIGSHLCERLRRGGHEVICIDNFVTGRRANLVGLTSDPQFTLVEWDIINGLPDLPVVDRVYHLASPASPPGYQRYPLETLRVNSEGTRHLLELALRDGARYLYTSTSEVYGDPLEHPQREDYRGNVSTTGPRSMYDEAKRYGEAIVTSYFRDRGADARIVRIFNTYGPHSDPQDGRLIPNLITQALRGAPMTIYAEGDQTRSLCYVSDLVEGLLRMMEAETTSGMVVNLGNPEEHTVLEYADVIRNLTGSTSDFVFTKPAVGDDPQRRRPDIERARTLLDWEPQVALRDGLARTIEYFRRELKTAPVAARPARLNQQPLATKAGGAA